METPQGSENIQDIVVGSPGWEQRLAAVLVRDGIEDGPAEEIWREARHLAAGTLQDSASSVSV